MNRKSISDTSGLQMSRNIPIAESTHISADETSLIKNSPVSSSSKFQWGGKMTPKRKATSPLLNNKSIFKSNLSVQRIDPQTYLDTQSKGLVSRIVKYHDISQRAENKKLPKSIYNKPGQFPIVNLRKNEIIYSPKRNQNSTKSIVRIPPPDSSIYDVASRSSILRTGSILNLSQEQSQINENEPLTHSGDETVPTRSVLDALKEISRKRINSEDLEIERHKKHCTETNDQFDGPTRINSGILAKRQRDIPVCTVISTEQQKKRMCSKNNDILSSLSSSLHMTTPKRKVSDMTIQPEGRQVNLQQKTPDSQSPPHKKQIRSDLNVEKTIQLPSNDVLPESLLKVSAPSIPVQQKQTVPKLTLFNRNYTTDVETKTSNVEDDEDEEKISFVKPKKSSSFSSGKNEVLKQMDNRKLALMLSCLKGDYEETDDEVDAVPEKKKDEEIAKVVLEVPKISTPIEIPKPATPKTITPIVIAATTTPVASSVKTIAPPATAITTATTTPAKINLINFETPQKPAGFALPTATTIQPTTTAAVTTTTTTSFVLPAKTSVTTAPIMVKPIQTPSFGLPEVKTTSVPSGGFSFGNKPAITTTSSTTATVPSFGFGAQNKPSTVTTTTTPTSGFTIAKTVTAAPLPQQPTGGFSFGQNATTTSSTPSFGQNSVPATTPSFGKTIIPTTTTATPSFGQTTVPNPVFGQSTVPASTPAFSQSNGAPPAFGQNTAPITFGQTSAPTPSFGFNSLNANTTPKTTPSDNKVGFSFGGSTATAAPKTFGINTPVTTTQSSGSFSFGQTQDSTPKTFGNPGVFGQNSVNETATAPSAGMFSKTATPSFGQVAQPSFGQNTNPTAAPSAGMFGQAAPPAFGQNTPATAAPPAFGQNTPATAAPSFGNLSNSSSPAFSFGGSNANKATPETNMFKFGGSSAPQATSQPSFGSVAATATPATTTNSTFSFSSGSTAKPAFGSNNGQSAPSFGGIVTNSQSTPSFGNPAPNVNVFGGSSFTSAQNTAAPPAQSSAFAFGGAQNLTTNNAAPSPFAFASNTAKPVATNSTPSFGGVANNTNNSAFSFGNNAPVLDANKTPSGAFNFGSSAPQQPGGGGFGNNSFGNLPAPANAPPPAYGAPQQQQQQQNPANLFVVGPGSGTPQRRIRTAARRMK